MSAKQLPPLSLLRKKVIYDPITGLMLSTSRMKQPARNSQGYICFQINGQYCAGHRIAWALYYGARPDTSMEIDHINGDRSDNRIANLRLVSRVQNLRNKTQYKNCRHGYPGIINDTDGRKKSWRAQINVNGKNIKVGSFRCKTAAIFARKVAEAKYGFTELAGDAKWRL